MHSNQQRLPLRSLLSLFAICLTFSACGDDGGNPAADTCSAGELCECTLPTDCPVGETCNGTVCLPAADASGDTTPDAATDTDAAADVETPQDVQVDADVNVEDTTDAADVDPADVSMDVETGADIVADVPRDTTPADAVEEDTTGFPPPGNPWIAYIQAEKLRFIHADGTGDIEWLGPESDRVFSADWSPDGSRLAVLAADSEANGGLQLVNFASRTVTLVSLELESVEIKPFTSVAWSPDGETIAFSYRPRGSGTVSGIYTVSVSEIASAGDVAVVPTRAATPVSGDTNPVWGQTSDDLYFLRTDAGDTTIVRMEFPGGEVTEVVTGLDILGIFDLNGTEDLAIAQVAGAGASGALAAIEIDGRDDAFGLNGDAAPSFFPPGDNRVAIVRNFAAGGSPQNDMVIVDLDTDTPTRVTFTGISAGPAFMSVAPVDNGSRSLGPFPF